MRSFVLVRSVALLRPDTSQISAAWLVLFLRSPEGQRQIWAGVKEQAQPCLYINRMKTMGPATAPTRRAEAGRGQGRSAHGPLRRPGGQAKQEA